MTDCSAGDIVLIRFPFTDLSTTKQRPAVVISPSAFASRHGDLVVLALSSRTQPDEWTAIERWREAGLPRPTWIKPLLATIGAAIVIKTLGRLPEEDSYRIEQTIRLLIAGRFLTHV